MAGFHGDDFINKMMKKLARELNKVFGDIGFLIGGAEGCYELMLSPEGNRDKLFLSRFWKEMAPEIAGWQFFNCKQPNRAGGNLKVHGKDDVVVGPSDFLAHVEPEEDREKLGVEIYCEKLAQVDKETGLMYIFLMLDDCLGEGYTETAIGQIDFIGEEKPDMIPMTDLYAHVVQFFADREWTLFRESGSGLFRLSNEARRRDPKTPRRHCRGNDMSYRPDCLPSATGKGITVVLGKHQLCSLSRGGICLPAL